MYLRTINRYNYLDIPLGYNVTSKLILRSYNFVEHDFRSSTPISSKQKTAWSEYRVLVVFENFMTLWPCLCKLMSDQVLTSYIYIIACTSYQFRLVFTVISHWNNSPYEDILLQSDILPLLRANQSLNSLINVPCTLEKQQIPL